MGEMVNKKKLVENICQAAESLKEITLDSIPGGAVLKAIWNYSSELQTTRSLKFLGEFQKTLEDKLGRSFYEVEIQNEDFHDLFYAIIKEVQQTKSDEKLKRYKNILLKQVINPVQNYEMQSFLQLQNELNDIEIIMLDIVQYSNPRVKEDTFPIRLAYYNREIPVVDPGIQESVHINIGESDVVITDAQIMFLEHNLLNNGLIRKTPEKNPIEENGKNSNDLMYISNKVDEYRQAESKGQYYELTLFGESFFEYIKDIE